MRVAPASAEGCAGGSAGRSAVVVFCGGAELPWLKLLKPGFRHCFIIVDGGGGAWVSLNPMSHRTEVAVLAHGPGLGHGGAWTAEGLVRWFQSQGLRAVACRTSRTSRTSRSEPVPRKAAPWLPYTCVEAVKRVLGIHQRRVLTPWRLYLYINKYLN